MALTEEQLKQRIGRVTSSTAAACLGLDPRTSQIDAWLKIRGEDPAPKPEKAPVKPSNLLKKAIERGNRLEPYILEYGAEYLSDCFEVPVRMTPAEFRSIEDWTGDSCDALYWELGPGESGKRKPVRMIAIGEGKSASVGVGAEYGDEGTDDIPHHTLIQSHWHLIHWPEVDRCVVPVLVGGWRFEFRCYEVTRDPEFSKIILADLKEWHEKHIVGDQMPEARCSDENWLQRRYPKALKGAIEDTPELRSLAMRKWTASQQETKWKKVVCDLKAKLKTRMGEGRFVDAYWGKITWSENAASVETDWERLALTMLDRSELSAKERVELIGEHTDEKPGNRVLRVKIEKDHQDEARKEFENGQSEAGDDGARDDSTGGE
jgi:hypothetical protein